MLLKDGYCWVFLNWDVPIAWMVKVFTEASLGFLEDLPTTQVAPIISVSCNFPLIPKAKGGDLVVFRGTRVSGTEGEVCCCDDPSTQGATLDEVGRNIF